MGSAVAGLAGGFYAHFLTFIMPQNFGFGQSILILCMVVFGGGRDSLGACVGSYHLRSIARGLPSHHGVSHLGLWSFAFSHDALSARLSFWNRIYSCKNS